MPRTKGAKNKNKPKKLGTAHHLFRATVKRDEHIDGVNADLAATPTSVKKLKSEEDILDKILKDSKMKTDDQKNIKDVPLDKSAYYRGSVNIPTANAQFEYTADMVVELARCSEDILYFAENYFYIVNLNKGKKEKIQLYDAQRKALEMMRDNPTTVLLSSRQAGKCLQKKSTVKIRNKKTLEIEEVTVEELYNRAKNHR